MISSKPMQLIPYADDVVLIARTKRVVMELFSNLSAEPELVGLYIN